jgi:hypothetical protein
MGDHLGARVVADHSGAGARPVQERDTHPATLLSLVNPSFGVRE